jgi:hypothetical protein
MDNSKGRSNVWATFLWIAASTHFALFYTLNTRPMLNASLFEEGRESIPFQYRALTAWIMALVARFVHFSAALREKLPPRMNSPEDFTIFGIALVSMIAAVYATRKALDALTGDRNANRWWSLLVIFMAYFHYLLEFGHPCCTPLQLPYDLPSMAFFAAGLWLIVTRRIGWLYVLVFVAMLNRESIVFLIAIYFLYELGLRRELKVSFRSVPIHAGLLFAICLVTMFGLHHAFPHARAGLNRMGPFENHMSDNLGYILRPYYWTSYLSMFGFSWIYLYANWRRIPNQAIRYAMLIGPVMLAAMYVVGVLSEIRIFGEMISLFTVALTLLIRREFGLSMRNESRYPNRTANMS